jgi:membrane-bound lytic murein transglycosylase B
VKTNNAANMYPKAFFKNTLAHYNASDVYAMALIVQVAKGLKKKDKS